MPHLSACHRCFRCWILDLRHLQHGLQVASCCVLVAGCRLLVGRCTCVVPTFGREFR